MEKQFNLNHGKIYLTELPCGKTQNIVVKVGRRKYYLDIDINSTDAYVQRYAFAKNRESISKYAVGCVSVFCKPTATLDREFIEQMESIEKAQEILRKFVGIVK